MGNDLQEEEALVRRAQGGDRAAFAALYDRHQPAIYNYVFYRVGSTPLAEDLTAEVFVRMVEKIDTFRGQGRPLLAWLYTIAGNLVIDHYRRAGRIDWQPLQEGERTASQSAGPEQKAEAHLDHLALAQAMEQLTEDQRRVVLLKFIEQRSNAEVAAILGKRVGAVKALQHRALAALCRILRDRRRDESD
jgi:RNA polymerase sigma-70 factor (ECF subfamily)